MDVRAYNREATVEGEMRDLSAFEDERFDLIFHPCSNSFGDAGDQAGPALSARACGL